MHKLWKLKESKFNKLIFVKNKVIYKGNPKEFDLNRINEETTDLTFLNTLFSIPYSYIKKIENQKGKNYIKIFFGDDSEEELYIENENLKKEIFEYLKEDNETLEYNVKIPSVFNYAKSQFFAFFFLTGIFIWSLYLAFQIEDGVEYELIGGGSPGIVGIILTLANLGSLNITIGYLILVSITVFALIKRLKHRTEIEILVR